MGSPDDEGFFRDDNSLNDVALLGRVAARIPEGLGGALAAAQGDTDPCWCPACVAEAASLN
jgi:hypothetical protein